MVALSMANSSTYAHTSCVKLLIFLNCHFNSEVFLYNKFFKQTSFGLSCTTFIEMRFNVEFYESLLLYPTLINFL